MKKSSFFVSLLLFALVINLRAQPGSLDPSFGDGGIVTTDLANNSYDMLNQIVIQSDNKIVAVGMVGTTAVVVRYTEAGAIDNSFGNNGSILIPGNASLPFTNAKSVAIQSDGKLIVGVMAFNQNYVKADFKVARLLPNGAMDNSFGSNGIVTMDFRGLSDELNVVLIQPDGKIIAVGRSDSSINENPYFVSALTIARFNSDGSPDMSFGQNGTVVSMSRKNYTLRTPITAGLTSKGNLILACNGQHASYGSAYDVLFVSYKSDGTVDSSFGRNGKVAYGNSVDDSFIGNFKILPDDKILLCLGYSKSYSPYTQAILKLNEDGTRDLSFGRGGFVQTLFDQIYSSSAQDLIVQDDGKIVLTGDILTAWGGKGSLSVSRYFSNGTLDSSFGVNGLSIVPAAYSNSYGSSIAQQADGKIVVGGQNIPVTSYYPDFMIARFNNDVAETHLIAGNTNNAIIKSTISIFPNPATDILHVRGLSNVARTTIMLTNNSGIPVKKMTTGGQSSVSINVMDLKPGIYFLSVSTETHTQTLKFIKQ